jgi:hypothetical protein
MARRSKELEAHSLSLAAAVESGLVTDQPVELQTENGFHILRRWEIEKAIPPVNGTYQFLVHNENQPMAQREIVVQASPASVALIERATRGRITRASSFWIYCAERHLATYLWETNNYPPRNELATDPLTAQDFALAVRWETT